MSKLFRACSLVVDQLFRKRLGEKITRFGDLEGLNVSHHEQKTFSLIAVAAFLAATALTDISEKTNVFAMMEPFLPGLLKRSGILFQKAGHDIDYRGLRASYFIKTQVALDGMRGELRDLYYWIDRQILEAY